MSIQRYSRDRYGDEVLDPEGKYVKFKDHEKALAEAHHQNAELQNCLNVANTEAKEYLTELNILKRAHERWVDSWHRDTRGLSARAEAAEAALTEATDELDYLRKVGQASL